MRPFECVLCGGASLGVERWSSAGWRVIECHVCGLLRTWPPPDAEDLRSRYNQPEYHDSRTAGRERADAWRVRAASVTAELPGTTSSILDFGAGRGQLVRALREREIEAEGIDPSSASRDEALESHGVRLYPSIPREWARRFDAIVMLHSLEHVANPVATLEDLRAVLRPGGRVLIEVPHAGGVGIRFAARRMAILDLPLHLHHFTPRTLSMVLARSGYEVEMLRLINTRGVEGLLSWRATITGGSWMPGGSDGSARAPRIREPGTHGAARAWSHRVLPALRRAFPGDTFYVRARPA